MLKGGGSIGNIIYHRVKGVLSREHGDTVRRFYSSPLSPGGNPTITEKTPYTLKIWKCLSNQNSRNSCLGMDLSH